jgi:hypothetical protein
MEEAEILDKALKKIKPLPSLSEKCRIEIEKGPICHDGYETFTGQRRYVMCRAFDLLGKGEVKDLGEGITEGWDEVHRKCGL